MRLIEMQLNKTHQKGKCQTRHCKNVPSGTMCGTCRARKWRIEHPEKYAYNNLKNRAKQRGIEFTLTFEEFKKFCIKTKYIAGKGRHAEGLTVDRRDNTKGYTADNIRTLTLSKNIKIYLSYDWQHKTAVVY
jgi:hypothetical protein